MASSKHQIRVSTQGVWDDIREHAQANGSHPGWKLEELWNDFLARNPKIAETVKARALLREAGKDGKG